MTRHPHVTLQDYILGKVQIQEVHLQQLKGIASEGLRAQWKKDRLKNLNLHTLRQLPMHWTFQRIVFYGSGRCEFIPARDYHAEMKEVQKALIGKK